MKNAGKTIGDMTEARVEQTGPPSGRHEFSYVDISSIDRETKRIVDPKTLPVAQAPSRAKQVLRMGDVLVSMTRPNLNAVALVPPDLDGSIGSTGFHVLRAKGEEPRFLFYAVQTPDFIDEMCQKVQGALYPAVRPKDISSFLIPSFSLPEQRLIVAEIEKQFTRLEAGMAALKRVQANLKRYRAAVLKAACEGKIVPTEAELAKPDVTGKKSEVYENGEQLLKRILTVRRRKWSGRGIYKEPAPPDTANLPQLPEGWTWASVGQLGSVQLGRQRSPKNISRDFPTKYMRAANITENGLDLSDVLEMEFTPDERERYLLKRGDLIISEASGSISQVGKPAIWHEELPQCCFQNTIIRLQPVLLDSRFPLLVLRHFYINGIFAQVAVGVGINHLGAEKFSTIPFPLPPLDEQTRIVTEVERRMSVVEELEAVVNTNLQRGILLRQKILQQAFSGQLVSQDPCDGLERKLLEHIHVPKVNLIATPSEQPKQRKLHKSKKVSSMKSSEARKRVLETALSVAVGTPTARDLFNAAQFGREEVYEFYDTIADSAKLIKSFTGQKQLAKKSHHRHNSNRKPSGPFRLHEIWIKKFKNLEDYSVIFDPNHAVDVLLGWNGTGKSNLFEVLVAIFRDLYKWQTKDKWTPQAGLEDYRIRYEIDGQLVEIDWQINLRKPQAKIASKRNHKSGNIDFNICKREEIPLPHFVFGYYSGPSKRFADLFSEPKQEHYNRLLKQKTYDEETLARLLEERRFFNAETQHAKYALLAFFYEDDPGIHSFLKKHLRIEDLESVLFVLKRPRWYRNNNPEDFWGADGLLRPVLEHLRRHSIAHMVLQQRVDDGFQESAGDHYFLLLPSKKHLQKLASEYADPTSFFVALECTDFSSIIHEVRIRIRINATATKQTVVTFKEMSEGEQQLMMVLGLLRFTKMNQSLVLLDEPDTHLNPHWQLGYLHLLLDALVGDVTDKNSPKRLPFEELEKRLNSQVLLSTHDPLAIAGLLKENIHLLKRREQTEECFAALAGENLRGMGFTGILTSEMFGLKSDLDDETLCLLDKHAELAGKKRVSVDDLKKLQDLTKEVEHLGFKSASSDPYYRIYLQALGRRRKARDILHKPAWNKKDIENLAKETDKILDEIEHEEGKI